MKRATKPTTTVGTRRTTTTTSVAGRGRGASTVKATKALGEEHMTQSADSHIKKSTQAKGPHKAPGARAPVKRRAAKKGSKRATSHASSEAPTLASEPAESTTTATQTTTTAETESTFLAEGEIPDECILQDFFNLSETIWSEHDKATLVLDQSGNIDTFFRYRAVELIEAKQILMQKIRGDKTVEEINEENRQKLVRAIARGNVLLIRMDNTAVDFVHQFSSEDAFPIRTLLTPSEILKDAVHERLVRDADATGVLSNTSGLLVPREGFRVVVTSAFTRDSYAEYLAESLPLDRLHVLSVVEHARRLPERAPKCACRR